MLPSDNKGANLQALIADLNKRFPTSPKSSLIIISISEQKLFLIKNSKPTINYPISSAKAGTGNLVESFKTPLGVHQIAEKIGDGAKSGSIFKARINTLKIAKILTTNNRSNVDNITSRILRLRGLEDGINKGENIDSYERYIYIHGTDEEGLLGTSVSHGCIRMANQAVIDLFEHVKTGTLVTIIEEPLTYE